MVVWFIGISGSGKTTLGRRTKEFFDSIGRKAYHIDGDAVRDFYDNDVGYTKEERMLNVKRIILAAHILSENGVIAIVSNISPFEELRDFCRRKIADYNEIYLKRSLEACISNDVKKMYLNHNGRSNIVGIDVAFEEPRKSDLIIDVDRNGVGEAFEMVIGYLKCKYPKDFS